MSRRSAYLLIWGIAFLAMGRLLAEIGGEEVPWAMGFVFAGVLSLSGGLTTPRILDTLGFVSLAGMAAARAVWHSLELLSSPNLIGTLSAVTLWFAVALAQVVVAGWPEAKMRITFRVRGRSGVE